jgi:hypothetical protein
VLDAGKDGRCPHHVHFHIGIRDAAPARVTALEVLRAAIAADPDGPGVRNAISVAQEQANRLQRDLEEAVASENNARRQYNAVRLLRGRQQQQPPLGAAAATTTTAAPLGPNGVGDPPELEGAAGAAAGSGRVVVLGQARSADGVFEAPPLRLRQGAGTREGEYSVRLAVRQPTAAGGAPLLLCRARPDGPRRRRQADADGGQGVGGGGG